MWMILGHHFVGHNSGSVDAIPDWWTRNFMRVALVPGGKWAVAVFVAVSCWYLCSATGQGGELKASVRRVLKMEGQLLFYSIALYLATSLLIPVQDITPASIITAATPLLSATWWFASAYAVLVLLGGYLFDAVRALGQRRHAQLCLLLVLLFGVLPFVPWLRMGTLSTYGDFLAMAVFISYIRWYVPAQRIARHRVQLLAVLVGGAVVTALACFLSMVELPVLSRLAGTLYRSFGVSPCTSVLSLSIALPLSLLALTAPPFSSRAINAVASAAFGVYLATDYWVVRHQLWEGPFSFDRLGYDWLTLPHVLGLITAIYLVATALELARKRLVALVKPAR